MLEIWKKACVELAKDWRNDKILKNLDAMLIVGDKDNLLILSGVIIFLLLVRYLSVISSQKYLLKDKSEY